MGVIYWRLYYITRKMDDGKLQTGDSTTIVHTVNEDTSITVTETVDINTDSTSTLVTDTLTPNRIELEVALSDGQHNTRTLQLLNSI